MRKKTWIGIAALLLALMVFCTACGGSNEDAPSEKDASPTLLPSVTAPPKGEDGDDGMLKANANGSAAAYKDRASWLASLSEEQRMVEEELIGKSVEELYKAIGKPKSATYGTSCLVADGEDGILTYDGFTVSTTRFPNGQEQVMGTAN